MPLTRLSLALLVLCAALPASHAGLVQRHSLTAAQVRSALTNTLISYSPPGWADAGVHEEFHSDGRWKGIYYSRGPIEFGGRWIIRDNQVCVSDDPGTIVAAWFAGQRCRKVWRDLRTGQLLTEYLDPRLAMLGLLPLRAAPLPVDHP